MLFHLNNYYTVPKHNLNHCWSRRNGIMYVWFLGLMKTRARLYTIASPPAVTGSVLMLTFRLFLAQCMLLYFVQCLIKAGVERRRTLDQALLNSLVWPQVGPWIRPRSTLWSDLR